MGSDFVASAPSGKLVADLSGERDGELVRIVAEVFQGDTGLSILDELERVLEPLEHDFA